MASSKNKRTKEVKSNPNKDSKKTVNMSLRKRSRKSPSLKGKPKKVLTLKEALQISFNKEISIKNKNGGVEKITCLEALASKTIADAIEKDGPTRRLLYRQDFMNLVSKEQEYEYEPEKQKIVEVEREYGELLKQWAELDPEVRSKFSRIISNILIDMCNEKSIKGEENE